VDFKDFPLEELGVSIQLVGAIYENTAREETYYVFLPGEEDQPGNATLRLTQDDWVRYLRQADLVEVSALVKEHGKIGRAIIRKCERQIDAKVSWQVFRRDNFCCRYCGNDNVPLTVDHLVLWEDGGPSTPENLVACDKRCNRTRGNMPYAEWLKHPYYKKVSAALTETQREANEALIATLNDIPLKFHKRKR